MQHRRHTAVSYHTTLYAGPLTEFTACSHVEIDGPATRKACQCNPRFARAKQRSLYVDRRTQRASQAVIIWHELHHHIRGDGYLPVLLQPKLAGSCAAAPVMNCCRSPANVISSCAAEPVCCLSSLCAAKRSSSDCACTVWNTQRTRRINKCASANHQAPLKLLQTVQCVCTLICIQCNT